MLRIFKYLLFSIFFTSYSFCNILSWGESTRIDTSKKEIHNIIKEYVDKNYPKRVEYYQAQQEKIKQEKIKLVSHSTFVKDNLMWQDQSDNSNLKLNHIKATRYCKELELVNRKDWRLPTYRELLSLVEYSKKDPAISSDVKFIVPQNFWTSTRKSQEFWYVNFKNGESGYQNKMDKNYVRCVRDISKKRDDY